MQTKTHIIMVRTTEKMKKQLEKESKKHNKYQSELLREAWELYMESISWFR